MLAQEFVQTFFELDDEGLAKVIVEETEDPAVQDAIDGCPVGVIEAE